MRTRALAAVLVAALAAVAAIGLAARGGDAHAAPKIAKRVKVAFLFVQDAGGGTLTGPDDQHLTLRLTDVRDWVTRFDDRPFRAGQTVDVLDFLDRWHQRFAKSPPNAVLSFRTADDTHPRDMVLELRDPHYDAATKTIAYAARRIRRTSDHLPGTKHPLPPVVYAIPHTFAAASLFVDDADDEQCYDENDNPVSCYPDGYPGDGGGGGDYGGGSGGGPAMM